MGKTYRRNDPASGGLLRRMRDRAHARWLRMAQSLPPPQTLEQATANHRTLSRLWNDYERLNRMTR